MIDSETASSGLTTIGKRGRGGEIDYSHAGQQDSRAHAFLVISPCSPEQLVANAVSQTDNEAQEEDKGKCVTISKG